MANVNTKSFEYFMVMLSLFIVSTSNAQETDSINANHVFEQQIEAISEKALVNQDYSEIAENLDFLKSNKINLNSASADDLKQLPILDIFQINNFLNYRRRNGELYSIYELSSIHGFEIEIIRSIMPFIEIKPVKTNIWDANSIKNIFKYGKHKIVSRYQTQLQTPQGYITKNDSVEKKYQGDNYKIYSKYLFTSMDKLRFGITLENDAGEIFDFENSTLGFDFSSFHFEIKDLYFVKKLIIGDYNLEFGQGLAMWSSFSTNKSSEAINIVKLGRGIAPFTGTNENLFFRGVSTQLEFNNITISPFYSYNIIDASINIREDNTEYNMYESGLHRTINELISKNSLTKIDFGTDFSYNLHNAKVGITAMNTTFSNKLYGGGKTYQVYNFDKKTLSTVSAHYLWNLNTVVLSGEHATNINGSWATLHNASVNPIPEFSFVISYRNYQKEYFSATNSPFSEYSTSGEKGFYFGAKSEIHENLKLSAYIDVFEKTWLQYQKDAPSKGYETLLQFDSYINRSSSAYFRIKYEKKSRNVSIENNFLNQLQEERKLNLRLQFNKIINYNLRLASRVEFVKYSHVDSENGWLIYQDINWKPNNTPFSIYGRVAFFDIDSWDSRIYAYESDILYIFTVPAYYNKGIKYYFGIKYQMSSTFSFWARISQTEYEDVKSIGNGNEEIFGNQRTEIKLQMRIKL